MDFDYPKVLTLSEMAIIAGPMFEAGKRMQAELERARILFVVAKQHHARSHARMLADEACGKHVRARRRRAIKAEGKELDRLERELFAYNSEMFSVLATGLDFK